jgi:hypothetical protein
MARKPRIKKIDAMMIALRYATASGITPSGDPNVHGPDSDGNWSVFIPDGREFEPGGVLITVDSHSGQAAFVTTL